MHSTDHGALCAKIINETLATVDGEPSEVTAYTAAAVAMLELHKYQATLTAAQLQTVPIAKETYDRGHEVDTMPADRCFPGLQRLCSVRIWYSCRAERTLFNTISQHRLMAVIGLAPDVLLTHRLYDIIDSTIAHCTGVLKLTPRYRTVKLKSVMIAAFEASLADRINQRLNQLATAAIGTKTSDGLALISVKDALVAEAAGRLQLNLHKRKLA